MTYEPRGDTELERLVDYIRRADGERIGARARIEEALASTRVAGLFDDLHTGGFTHGGPQGHSGFREEFRDPWQSSRNQVGHFLTAVGHGMHGVGTLGAMIAGTHRGDRHAAMRLDIGHELRADPALNPLSERPWAGPRPRTVSSRPILPLVVLDPRTGGFGDQYRAATESDVACFSTALDRMNADPDGTVRLTALRADLVPIITRGRLRETRIVGRDGNSIQDLLLTAMGWHLAALVARGVFSNASHAARWIQRNLGA